MARGRKKDIEKQQMYLVKLKKYIAKKEKQNLIKDLGDGLVLRRSTPADAEKLSAFNSFIHNDSGEERIGDALAAARAQATPARFISATCASRPYSACEMAFEVNVLVSMMSQPASTCTRLWRTSTSTVSSLRPMAPRREARLTASMGWPSISMILLCAMA